MCRAHRRARLSGVTHAFWTWQLVLAMVLNCLVQTLAIAAYAARLAGARSGRVATAISLYNIFGTSSRFAQMLYMPLLGSLSDHAASSGLGTYQWQLRDIVFAGTAGAVLGTLALPTFVMLYLRAIRSLERHGSVPKAMLGVLRRATVFAVLRDVKFGVRTRLRDLSFQHVPKDVFVLNTVVTAIYGIGIVSATYASVLDPQAARTAILSSGLVNGFAVIAYNIVVDPTVSLIADQAARGERSTDDVKALVAGLAFTAVLGFLCSQLLLVPGALLIAWAARVVVGR
jgi:Alternate to MurJ